MGGRHRGGSSADAPRIYVADLAAYNAGQIHGEWVDLDGDERQNTDQIQEAIARVLESSPVEGAEEIAVHDHEGFGSLRVGEYPDLEEVAKLAALINEHGTIVGELVSHFGGTAHLDEAVRHLEEGFEGEFDSLEAWAEQYFDDSGMLSEVPESLRSYIDFERWANDAEMSGDVFTVEHDGRVFVFRNV